MTNVESARGTVPTKQSMSAILESDRHQKVTATRTSCFIAMVILYLLFGVIDILEGKVLGIVLNFGMAGVGWIWLTRFSRNSEIAENAMIVSVLLVSLHTTLTALFIHNGSVGLWFLATPVFVMGLFSIRVGSAFTLLNFLLMSYLIHTDDTLGYDWRFKAHIQEAYILLAIGSYIWAKAYKKSEDRLSVAFSNLEFLEGLLMTCSFCKAIKTPTGEWASMEQFVGEKAEVKFSHGYCPICAKKHYPSL